MAAGLFHRPSRDQRAADDEQTLTEDAATQEQKARTEGARADTAPTYAQRVVAAAKERAAARRAEHDREVADGDRTQVLNRHPRAAAEPVPPGGAVAPPRTATDTTISEGKTEEKTAPTERAPQRWARTSFAATLSLILGTCAILFALSGRLAPLAIAVGVLGLLISGAGFAAVARKHVTGHHVVLLGLVFSLVGIVFGVLALSHALPWLNGNADQASQFRDWLNTEWAKVKTW